MKKYFTSSIGRLRLVAFLEGLSLLLLVFIAMPLKYIFENPSWVKSIGMVHGILFIVFILNTISVSIIQQWKFSSITWKVLLSSIIPFGTFYIDHTILSKLNPVSEK